MEQELDYAEMLEIPVSTVNVVKKKGLKLFKRKAAKPAPQTEPSPQFEEADELKNLVVDSVNERVGAYVYAEDLSDPQTELPADVAARPKRDKGSIIVLSELIAVCVIAVAIFLTNIFMPTSVINTFISSLANGTPKKSEPAYSDIKLSAVVSDLSEAGQFHNRLFLTRPHRLLQDSPLLSFPYLFNAVSIVVYPGFYVTVSQISPPGNIKFQLDMMTEVALKQIDKPNKFTTELQSVK